MSQDCYCNLLEMRNFGSLLDDLADQKGAGSLSQWVASMSELGEQSGLVAGLSIDFVSASPRSQTLEAWVDGDSVSMSWQARNYPSLEFVVGLSRAYPGISFEFDWESLGYSKGRMSCENGRLGEVSQANFGLEHWDLLLEAGILDINNGETRDLGKLAEGMVECVAYREDEDGRMHKTFSIRFSADDSLMVKVTIGSTGECLDYSYTDADGNSDFNKNGYANEFLSDLQD